MREESKLYFWDAAGKFEAVKEEAYDACRDAFDLTVYSLSCAGSEKPARLIVKMTPIGKPEGYLSMQAGVAMCSLNYESFPAGGLKKICSYMESALSFELLSKQYCALFKQGNGLFRGFGQGNDPFMVKPITVSVFFGIDPREGEPGSQIYLRDKAFFLSARSDSGRADFYSMQLLTDDEKANVSAIDLSRADVRGRKVLSRMFKGYKSVCQLDLSAFDTASAIEMEEMFFQCQSLRRLDLSAFDFSQVKHLKNIFGQCRELEEVILSDTILGAGRIPHATGRCTEVLRSNYRLSGPYPGEQDYTIELEKIFVPFSEATEEELHEHLGLAGGGQVKLTIVPHRRCKNSS